MVELSSITWNLTQNIMDKRFEMRQRNDRPEKVTNATTTHFEMNTTKISQRKTHAHAMNRAHNERIAAQIPCLRNYKFCIIYARNYFVLRAHASFDDHARGFCWHRNSNKPYANVKIKKNLFCRKRDRQKDNDTKMLMTMKKKRRKKRRNKNDMATGL